MFLNNPNNRCEMLESESLGFRFVNIVFLLSSIFIFFVLFRKLDLSVFSRYLGLGLLLTVNGITYLIFSKLAHKYSKDVLKITSLLDLEKIKKSFYYHYLLVIGIPYLGLTFWIYLYHDTSFSLEMFSIFVVTLTLMYFVDWKRFIKLKNKYSDFF